jgi:AcrR family transcriptional regulator
LGEIVPATQRATRAADKRRTVRLGRRPGDAATAETIIEVAEREFAKHGFAGVSLRDIGEKAQVNPALVRYYFGSKDKLFREVVLRRGRQISRRRIELLDDLERHIGEVPKLEELVRAFLTPVAEVRREGPAGMAFVRLAARLQTETQKLARELRRQVYAESTERYLSAFRRALPNLTPAAIYWRMVSLIGAYVYAMSDANQLRELSKGLCSPDDIDESLRQLIPFLCAGMRAPECPRDRR